MNKKKFQQRVHLISGSLNQSSSKFNRSMDGWPKMDTLNKRRKKMAADVRAESSDAHVRDLQSKYLERFSCSTKKNKHWKNLTFEHFVFLWLLCTTIMGLLGLCSLLFYEDELCMKFCSYPRCGRLTFVVGIRCANIYYCSFVAAKQTNINRNGSSICGWQFNG